ncbi:MAG: hypothetical protein ABFR75_01525 [Acidobacteriota bacterium]
MDKNIENFFEEYTKPEWKKPKFWILIIFIALIFVSILYIKAKMVDSAITEEDIRSSIEIFDISSQWIEKEKIENEDFKGIIMVPQISFRMRNVGTKPMENVYLLGVFRGLYIGKSIGEGFVMSLKKPLQPGNSSSKIIINSTFGYKTTSKVIFKKMSKEWGKTVVELYMKSSSSKLFFFKSFYIRQIVEGMSSDVKLNN